MKFSSKAYQFLWNERDTILNALLISVAVTCIGTLLGLSVTTAMGYALSRPNFKLKQFYTWVIFIPMLFSGGLVASYVVNSNILGLRNTIWVLILPLMVSSYNIVICKTYFKTSIPDGIIESAKIDGATQMRTFLQHRDAHFQAAVRHHRPVPELRLLERLVPVVPVHFR